MSDQRDRTLSKENTTVEPTLDLPLFEGELPDKRCVDLGYLLLSLPPSSWVITVRESNTSLGEDLPVEEHPVGGKTRVGKFTGRRRL